MTQKKSSSEASGERPSVRAKLEKAERSSVRKIEKAESVSKLTNGHGHSRADRASAGKMASAPSPAPADRASSRKLERASRSDVNGAPKAERPSKADLKAEAGAHHTTRASAKDAPPVKRSWRRELFRAMVDALRDILRAERRPS